MFGRRRGGHRRAGEAPRRGTFYFPSIAPVESFSADAFALIPDGMFKPPLVEEWSWRDAQGRLVLHIERRVG